MTDKSISFDGLVARTRTVADVFATLKAPAMTDEQKAIAPLFNEHWRFFGEALVGATEALRMGTATLSKQRERLAEQQAEIAQQQAEIDRLKRSAEPADPVVVLAMLLLLGSGWPIAVLLYQQVFGVDVGAYVIMAFAALWGFLVCVAIVQLMAHKQASQKKGKWPW